MITGDNPINLQEMSQGTLTFKDFVMGERIKKVTTHNLFELIKNNQTYVAKLFQPQFHDNYLIELNNLRQLNHPNIVKLVYSQSAEADLVGSWNYDMLVLKSAQHGSLNDYIPQNGPLPQPISRILFKQMIAGLQYGANKQPNPIIHPDLLPSNILLDAERNIKICGWSKQTSKKDKKDLIQDLLFCCCEILILIVTGYMPFFKKDAKVDPLYRYLKPQFINKFWQILEKRVTTKHKSFQFSKNIKQMIEKVFLGEWRTFQEIKECAWIKQPQASTQQFKKFMSGLESNSNVKRQAALLKQYEKSQQKRKLISEYEQQTLRGSSSRDSSCRSSGEFDIFIQDYYDHLYHKKDVPASQCSELIRLFDDRPNFVIATLKQHLRTTEEEEINFIFGGEFKLQNYEVQNQNNEFFIQLQFSQIHQQLMDPEQDVEIKVKALIKFCKNEKNNLYAEVKILESNLSQFYATQIMKYIEDKLRGFEE